MILSSLIHRLSRVPHWDRHTRTRYRLDTKRDKGKLSIVKSGQLVLIPMEADTKTINRYQDYARFS